MIVNDVIADMTKHPRFKEALEEMATHSLSAIGDPTCSTTFTAHLNAGLKTVRISVAMIDEGEMFSDDIEG